MAKVGSRMGYIQTDDGKYVANHILRGKIYSTLNRQNRKNNSPQLYSVNMIQRLLKNRHEIILHKEAVRQFIERLMIKSQPNKWYGGFLTKANEGVTVKYYLEKRYKRHFE